MKNSTIEQKDFFTGINYPFYLIKTYGYYFFSGSLGISLGIIIHGNGPSGMLQNFNLPAVFYPVNVLLFFILLILLIYFVVSAHKFTEVHLTGKSIIISDKEIRLNQLKAFSLEGYFQEGVDGLIVFKLVLYKKTGRRFKLHLLLNMKEQKNLSGKLAELGLTRREFTFY